VNAVQVRCGSRIGVEDEARQAMAGLAEGQDGIIASLDQLLDLVGRADAADQYQPQPRARRASQRRREGERIKTDRPGVDNHEGMFAACDRLDAVVGPPERIDFDRSGTAHRKTRCPGGGLVARENRRSQRLGRS
jgi:hypothetical protein